MPLPTLSSYMKYEMHHGLDASSSLAIRFVHPQPSLTSALTAQIEESGFAIRTRENGIHR